MRAHSNDLIFILMTSVKVLFPNKVTFWGTGGLGFNIFFEGDTIQPITHVHYMGLLGWLDETIHIIGLTQCLAHSEPLVCWLLFVWEFIMD